MTVTLNQRELRTTKTRKRALLRKAPHDIQGANVCLATGCATMFPNNKLRSLGVTLVEAMVEADIIVVETLDKAPQHVWLVAGIMGTTVATPTYLSNEGRIGACIGFGRATDVKRMVTVTEGFMVEHVCEASDICAALQMADCRWTFHTEGELHEVVGPHAPQRGRRQREVLAFMTQDEIDRQDVSSRMHMCAHGRTNGYDTQVSGYAFPYVRACAREQVLVCL